MNNTFRDGTFGFKPLGDLIVIEPLRPAVKTASGLIVAAAEVINPIRGKVLAVGPGKVNVKTKLIESIPVKEGDVVIFTSGAIHEVRIEGRILHLIPATSLLGVEV